MKLQRVRRPWLAWDERALRRNVGVYVHIPFCLARCRYCSFLTYGRERPPGLTPEAYAPALLTEIERRGAWLSRHLAGGDRFVDSVFFGGGTPTCLAPAALAELLQAVREHFPLAAVSTEVTVEANPDTLSVDYVAALAGAGVNRLSVGIQATQPRHLRFLGRTHRWDDVQPVLAGLRQGPIPRYSFDLIYGIPRLTVAELKESVRRVMRLGPEHVSAYELTREADTPYARWLARHPAQQASGECVAAQQQVVSRLLTGYGLYRYEVSNYARPGAECRHNLRYWRGGDYLGLGLGAASRFGSQVVSNPGEFESYQRTVEAAADAADPLLRLAEEAEFPPPPADAFLRLRTRAGLPSAEARVDADWLRRGWVRITGDRCEVTGRGLSFADLLAREQD